MTAARPLQATTAPAEAPLDERAGRALAACEYLGRTDPRLAALIARVGPHRPLVVRSPFLTLVNSILQQQVSMKAAEAIRRRLRDKCAGRRITPKTLLSLRPLSLRAAGLSRQKALYMHELARAFESKRLTPGKLRAMSDEEVIAAATQVKGIGRWTAEMLLMFCLERPDVWPVDDLGLRKALHRFLGAAGPLDRKSLVAVGEPWRPYRSYAAWYLWRSLEGPAMPGAKVPKPRQS